jgi:hypothetical protein
MAFFFINYCLFFKRAVLLNGEEVCREREMIGGCGDDESEWWTGVERN